MLIRGHHQFDGQFTQIPNSWLRDTTISLGAKGLLAQMLSHVPGWRVTIQGLADQNKCGKDRIRNYIRELETCGYLQRSEKQRHNEHGHLAGYDYTTCDPPLAGYPTKVKPTKATPTKGNPTHKNTIEKKNIEKKTIEEDYSSEFDSFWSVFPNRLGKGEARNAFVKAVGKVGVDRVLDGARRLAEDPNLPPKQYIPRPATWLNQERWDDDPYPPRGNKKAETKRLIDEWVRTEEK
jgi:hypothetical protein